MRRGRGEVRQRHAGENAAAKLALYANKSCTEQLRKIHGVGIVPPLRRVIDTTMKVVMVEADAKDRTGKTDTATGIVSLEKVRKSNDGKYTIKPLVGREYCNAIMKCETKAKRRATLSICGLGFLDVSELDNLHVVGGVTPDGRIYRLEESNFSPDLDLAETAPHGHALGSDKAKMAEASLKRVEEQDRQYKEQQAKAKATASAVAPKPATRPAPDKPNGNIEIDWQDPASPIIRGDLAEIMDGLKKYLPSMKWTGDWWHITPADAEVLRQFAEHIHFKITEINQKASPRGTGTAPAGRSAAAEPELLRGFVEQATEKMTPGKKATDTQKAKASVPFLSVLFREVGTPIKKHFITVWDHGMFEFVHQAKAKNAECVFDVKRRGDYVDLVALRRIGTTEFTDGKVPVIQQKDREAGGPTLFGQ